MSNEGRFAERNPRVITAGKVTAIRDESTANCINPQPINRPATPEHLKKFRKSHMQQVGTTIVHYGKYDDAAPEKAHSYGLQSRASDHMTDCIKAKDTEGYSKVINQISEEIYASTTKEPLGKRMDRGYDFPAQCGEEFKFGHPTIESANTVKDLLQTGFTLTEDEKVKQMYLKSHGNFQPAEQKNRDYNWPFDAKAHAFGKSEKIELNQVQRCVQPEHLTSEEFPQTKLAKKNIEDFRNFNNDHLGKPRNLGQTDKLVSHGKVFGVNTKPDDVWHAKECIFGEATFKDNYCEENLGRATKYGFRNEVRPGDENRVFGVPTIRSDIKAPAKPSIACVQNYGNEEKSVELLFPHGYSHFGLDQGDLSGKRRRKEIQEIFKNIGIEYGAGKFEGVWLRACEVEGVRDSMDSDAGVSVTSFLQAVKEMDGM